MVQHTVIKNLWIMKRNTLIQKSIETLFQYFYLAVLLQFHLLCPVTECEDLHFYVTEEARQGTLIASSSALGLIQLYSGTDKPRILNLKDPGVASITFRQTPSTSNQMQGTSWQLVVDGRLDRESICPTVDSSNNFDFPMEYSKIDFFIDANPTASSLGQSISSSGGKNSLTETNCVIVLRVATNQEGTQRIHPIHVHVQDINDNPPKWSQSSIVLRFRDGDLAGAKRTIPLATDADMGLNAVITYRLQDIDKDGADSHYTGQLRQNINPLRASDVFELIKESADSGHSGSRLSIRAKRDIDREANPLGWDLQIVASNSEGPQILSSQLLVHINITDVNDNAPQFSRTVYEPQLNNQKVGVVPENVPVGQVLVQLHATDADEGTNAQVKYQFASSPMLPVLQHFFEITSQGELRVRQRLDVDHKSGSSEQIPNFILPAKLISFEVIAIDGAEAAYAKTGYATVKLRVEDVDDEAPIIRVHPVHAWHSAAEESGSAGSEVEVAVTENEPAGQLIALVEVNDADFRGTEMVRCSLVGSTANLFRLSQQDVTSNEYRLYTSGRLDREENSRVKVTIECRDLADHISNQVVGVNVRDINDHAPKFTESFYRFSVLEDDGEAEVNHSNQNNLRSAFNRTWLTTDGRAFVTATDQDTGINERISYSIYPMSSGEEHSRFAINANTGQIYALGPFDREQASSHQFSVVAVDGGNLPKTGSCVVHVTVVDVNDNPPMFSPQVSTTGGYMFSIMENQLPGTRVGQVEAYDPDGLPASTEALDLSSRTTGHQLNRTNSVAVDMVGANKLVYGLKNEIDAHAFWIDPKSGVLITRSVLDREKQATYTFHVTVRDGPVRYSSSADEPTALQSSSRRPDRSHLISILVTVTVEDQNDNDPVFVRPNSTNHMVLLDPAAIPGQSLLQLHAIDPDEGLNGHVTYTIRGGNAGNLFNVDPRTGLLYLENQIPRRTIAEATAAAAAAVASGNSAATGADGFSGNDPRGQSHTGSDQVAAHPTYLLALEACDQGEPRRCTHFPNLQIQLRVSNDLAVDPATGQLLLDGSTKLGQLNSIGTGRDDSYLGLSFGGYWITGLSTAEILIISLSVFFALLILVIVITICVLRQRSRQSHAEVRQKDMNTLKRVGLNTVNNVELVDQAKSLRYVTNKTARTNSSRMYDNQDSPGHPMSHDVDPSGPSVNFSRVTLGPLTSTSIGLVHDERMHYGLHHPVAHATMYGPTPVPPEHYGLFSPAYSPNRMNATDYQMLEGWSAVDAQRYGPSRAYPAPINSPERRRYHTQPHSKLPTTESYNQSLINDSDTPHKELDVDLIPSQQTSQSGLSDTVNETTPVEPSSVAADSFSPRLQHGAKSKLQAYAGFPKSSFV